MSKTSYEWQFRLSLNESRRNGTQKMKKGIRWNLNLRMRLLSFQCVVPDDLNLIYIYSRERKEYNSIVVGIGQAYENRKESGFYIWRNGLLW